jgi:hypothetical protein
MDIDVAYLKIISGEEIDPRSIPCSFFRNFYFTKLALEKKMIHHFTEGQQSEMNLDAISLWMNSSTNIILYYDIPKIFELLPKEIAGGLQVFGENIVGVQKIKSIKNSLIIKYCKNISLPNLESVGWFIDMKYCDISEFPSLNYVGGYIFVDREKNKYWKNYFTATKRHNLVTLL